MKKIFKPIAVLSFLFATSGAYAQEGTDMFDILVDYITEDKAPRLPNFKRT